MKAGSVGLREAKRVSWAFMVVRSGSGGEFSINLGFVKYGLPSSTERHVMHTGLLIFVVQIGRKE